MKKSLLNLNDSTRSFVIDFSILLLCSAIFFWKALFVNRSIFFCSDYINFFIIHAYNSLFIAKNASFALWEPFNHGPFASLILTAIFYPFNMLADFFMSKVHGISNILHFFHYQQIIHYFLASVFMYLFARKIGMKRLGCIFSGIIFAYGGSLIGDLVHTTRLNASIWLPLIFLFLIDANQKKWIYSLVSGFFLGICFLAGAPQIALFTCLVLFLYSLYESYSLFKPKGTFKLNNLAPLRNCFIVFLIAFGVAAIHIIPVAEYAMLSDRTNPDFDKLLSLGNVSPGYLIQVLIPNFFASKSLDYWWGGNFSNAGPWEVNFYIGIIALIFAGLSFLSDKRKFVVFFFYLFIVSILLMLGKHTILSGWFFLIPGLGNARVPARYFFITNFSVAVLSGLGINVIINSLSKPKAKSFDLALKKLLSLLKTLVIISLPIFFIVLFLSKSQGNNQHMLIAIKSTLGFIAFFTVAVVLLILINKKDTKIAKILLYLLVVLAVFDLFLFQMNFNPIASSINPSKWSSEDELISYLKKDNDIFRVSGINRFKALYHKIPTRGYGREGSFGLSRRIGFEKLVYKDLRSRLFDLYNMKYITSDEDILDRYPGKFKKVKNISNLYENKNVLPRAFMIGKYKVVKDDSNILNELEVINPREYIILEEEPVLTGKVGDKVNKGSILVKEYLPHNVAIEASIKKSGFLFTSDIWYPGWEVYVDGVKEKLYRANYTFRAVWLNEGKHAVNFKYNPLSLKIGANISLVTLLSLISIGIISMYYKRK